ncbi:MAG TPA: arsenate reductase (glutaredoxin) [Nitrospiria bacterium]|jgi:arsenate reductase|nr:arsenate reductase (glutaredoxin) [Nitrospiria bacterium]
MADVTIYHNPRCGTSRKTLDLIRKKGIEPKVVEYLKTPPTEKELDAILKLLGMDPRELLRTKEEVYKRLKLENPKLSRAALIAAMVRHPILIQRPIVLSKGRAALGRPPENVEQIL